MKLLCFLLADLLGNLLMHGLFYLSRLSIYMKHLESTTPAEVALAASQAP